MPLHISLVLSLVLHLALYILADWVGLRVPPPPLRPPIEAMLILPEIKVAQADSRPAKPPSSPAVPAVEPPHTALPEAPPPEPVAASSLPAKTVAAPQAAPQPAVAFYPREAVLRGLEGDVDIGVTLDASGNVIAARIDRGSGHAILDAAALAAARTLKGLPGGAREATLPVRFRLR